MTEELTLDFMKEVLTLLPGPFLQVKAERMSLPNTLEPNNVIVISILRRGKALPTLLYK